MTAEAHGPGLGWKFGHSAWMVPALIGFGIFSWVSFAYVAARTRRQSLIALAIAFFIASAVASFWPEDLENTQGASWSSSGRQAWSPRLSSTRPGCGGVGNIGAATDSLLAQQILRVPQVPKTTYHPGAKAPPARFSAKTGSGTPRSSGVHAADLSGL